MPAATAEQAIPSLPLWRGPLTIAPLHGGLSNESWLVEDSTGKYVVRLGVNYPFHHVFRDRELMVARAAFAAGFAPEVVFAQPGCVVSRFIEGRTYAAADVRANIARIATLLRDFHGKMPAQISGPGFIFWPFHVIRDYARALAGSRHAANLPRYLALNDGLEAAQVPLPVIFGHHDLLPANFIDDGHRLWLIDFEYAGFGTSMFDLAGLAGNAQFTPEQSRVLLTAYFGDSLSPALIHAHAAMTCAALLREAMWAMVSDLHLTTPGVDFAAYAEENLARLDHALGTFGNLA